VGAVRAVFDRYELVAAEIGTIIDEPIVRCRAGDELVCEVPGRALADDAPRYEIHGSAPVPADADLDALAEEPISAATLLELLAAPNSRDRRPIWRRYDHMNGTNTMVGPGHGDAALLRVKGTARALALAIDGPAPARIGALDPYLAGLSAVLEGAVNVACMGAVPVGITDCLNFGSPETDLGAWQLERAIDGIADACRALEVPVVSGNVSLYNETPDGPILPTPVVGTVGLVEDRATTIRMEWADGDEIWLLGADAGDAGLLTASELAWRRGVRGGSASLDPEAVARVVRLLPHLAGVVRGAHDLSVGGLGVALARMALASGRGAVVELPAGPTLAVLHGERVGRVLVALVPERSAALSAALDAHRVHGARIGRVTGAELAIRGGSSSFACGLGDLEAAWRTAF
jgi:phosphoribosylformylglycinamidine synthase